MTTLEHLDDAAQWGRRRLPFRIALGDMGLGHLRVDLAVRDCVGDEPPLGVSDFARLARLLGRHRSGFALMSHPVGGTLPRLTRIGGALVYVRRQYHRFRIDLRGDFDAYQAKFSAKSRSTMRRKLRKFAELSGGTIDFRQYRTRQELAEFHRLASALSARTYQERLLNAGLPGDPGFVAELLQRAERDQARGYLLFVGDAPVSYLLCPVVDGVLQYAYLGYDPALSASSPGSVLQWCALEAIFAERRFAAFDFTEGEGEHKRFFATDSTYCANVIVLPQSLRSLALVAAILGPDILAEAAGRLLDRIGLKKRVRRLLRRE